MIESDKIYRTGLENVSETLLVPLFFKAKETLEKGVVRDYAAVEIISHIEYDFEKMSTDTYTQNLIAIRTKILDSIVDEYIRNTENPVIINLGAGLDTRHLRFKHAKWYQLDLERPMELRKIFFNDDVRITKSFLDFSWIDEICERKDILIIVEGVFMYLDKKQVQSIFSAIGAVFKNSWIVFDTIPQSFVKLKKHKSINLQLAPFKWGNSYLSEIEKWNYGFKKVTNYHYLSKWTNWRNIYNGFKVSLMQIN